MKSFLAILAVLCLTGVVMAQDNPIANVGTAGGGDLRTGLETVPYILGGGQGMYVKERIYLAGDPNLNAAYDPNGTAMSFRRPLSTFALTFDTDGSFYMNTITYSNGNPAWTATYTGTSKFSSAGVLQWVGSVANTSAGVAGAEPIVGTNYVYSQNIGSSQLYALNKTTGVAAWTTSLGSTLNMQPVLADGYLYGIESNGNAFCVDASSGAIRYETAVGVGNPGDYQKATLVPNQFGTGQYGMYLASAGSTRGLQVDPNGASLIWSQAIAAGAANNHYIGANYDPVTQQLYRFAAAGGPAGAQGLDPNTGNVLWLWNGPNQGGEMAVAPGGGFITGGQTNIATRIDVTKTYVDPNDGLTKLDPNTCVVWNNATAAEWPTTNRITVVTDPTTGRQVAIYGTTGVGADPNGNGAYNHRIMGVDPATGATIFEFQDPKDPTPTMYAYAGQLWRNLSVSPNGDLVFLMCEAFSGGYTDSSRYIYGTNGEILIVSALQGDTDGNHVVDVNDLNNVYNTLGTTGGTFGSYALGDVNGDGVVDVVDLNLVYNNLGLSVTPVSAEVPEPVTMALLSLGGLALLRRRK